MEELLKGLTRAANAVAAYYEAKALQEAAITATVPTTPKEVKKVLAAHVAVHAEMASSATPAAPAKDALATPPPAEPAAPKPEKRGRPKKDAAPASEAASLAVDPEFANLTPEESEKRIFEVGEDLIGKFPTLGAPGPDGEPAPEGFHILVGILKNSFKVGRVTKLAPAQRLQFMSIVKARLNQAASAAPAEETNVAGV